jgi:hypothetical protein
MTTTTERLLTTKELARELRRHPWFVYWMRRKGFKMPGGTATLSEAREWLTQNPRPCSRKH